MKQRRSIEKPLPSNDLVEFRLDKLVRDKLPDMMRELGQNPYVTTLHGIDHVRALIAKVAEELAELDPNDESFYKELSQVKQALMDLVALTTADDEIEQLRLDDLEKRGGFSAGYFVATLQLQPDDPWVEYYRKEPKKYRERKQS